MSEVEQVIAASRNDRQRQGGGDERGAYVAQEPPHHEDREQRSLGYVHRALVLLEREVDRRGDLGDVEPLMLGEQKLHGLPNAFGRADVVEAPRADDLKADYGLTVEHRGQGTLGVRVRHRGDLIETQRAAVGQSERQRREVLRRPHRRDRAYGLLRRAELAAPAGLLALHALQRLRNFRHGDVEREQLHGIDLDAHFALHAADAREATDAGSGQHAFAIVSSTNQDRPSSSMAGFATAKINIGSPATFTALTDGCSSSTGRSERTRSTASLVSMSASDSGFSSTNSTAICT
jgi:hypothetical protein